MSVTGPRERQRQGQPHRQGQGRLWAVARWVGLVLAGLAAAACLWLAPTLLYLTLAPHRTDPHGYGQIFGSFLLIVVTLVGVTALALTSLVLEGRAARWASRVSVGWMLVGLATGAVGLLTDRPPQPPL